MGRMSTVNEAEIFAAVGRRLSKDGNVTLQNVVADTGVSIGSLYHKYGSREVLLARTWIDAVKASQAEFLKALGSEHESAGELAALATPKFCRKDRGRAIILACCRKSEFITDALPDEIRQEIDSINDKMLVAIKQYSKQSGLSLDACMMGFVAFPLGAVRMYLPDKPVPKSVDDYVLAAFRSLSGKCK